MNAPRTPRTVKSGNSVAVRLPAALGIGTASCCAVIESEFILDSNICVYRLTGATRLTLVTNNGQDFTDIPGLRVENWTSPTP